MRFRFDLHDVVLFILSGLSVAALAVVSISPPVTLNKILLVTFGSVAAAIAAPMVESRISKGQMANGPKGPDKPNGAGDDAGPAAPAPSARRRRRDERKGASADAASTADVLHTILQPSVQQKAAIVGRDRELTGVGRRLVNQRNAGSR